MAPHHAPPWPIRQLMILRGLSSMIGAPDFPILSGANHLERILRSMGNGDQSQLVAHEHVVIMGPHTQAGQRSQDPMTIPSPLATQVPTASAHGSSSPVATLGLSLSEVAQAMIVLAHPEANEDILQSLRDMMTSNITRPDMGIEEAYGTSFAFRASESRLYPLESIHTSLSETSYATSASAGDTAIATSETPAQEATRMQQNAEMQQWRAEFAVHIKYLESQSAGLPFPQPAKFPDVHADELAKIAIREDIAQGILRAAPRDVQPLMLRVLEAAAADRPLVDGMNVEQALAGLRLLSMGFEERLRHDDLRSSSLNPDRLEAVKNEQAWLEGRLVFRCGEMNELEHLPGGILVSDDGNREWAQQFIKHVAALQPMEDFLARNKFSEDSISVTELKRRLPLLDSLALAILVTPRPYTPPSIQRMLEAVIWQPQCRLDLGAVTNGLRQLTVHLGMLELERRNRPGIAGAQGIAQRLDDLYARCTRQVQSGVSTTSLHQNALIPPAMAQELLDRGSRIPKTMKRMLHDLMSGLPAGLDTSDDAIDLLLNKLLENQARSLGLPLCVPETGSRSCTATESDSEGSDTADSEEQDDEEMLSYLRSRFPNESEPMHMTTDQLSSPVGHDYDANLDENEQHDQHRPNIILADNRSDQWSHSNNEDAVEQRLLNSSPTAWVVHNVGRELDGRVATASNEFEDLPTELFETEQTATQMRQARGHRGGLDEIDAYFPGDGDAISNDDEEQDAESGLFSLIDRRWTELTDEAQLPTAMGGLHLLEDGEIREYSDMDEVQITRQTLNLE
ncbi:hypothetical protein LTR86_008718 [Recurvomyces mirabilis]|nr:hypothetical protein LTR86_008718 [Recurvomyces mirabilis]